MLHDSVAVEQRSIDDGFFADIHGVKQWLTVRGSDSRNPVLFILHGTGFASSSMTPLFSPWEKDFTLVQWDQPGAGATHGSALAGRGAEGPLTRERFVRDGLAVTELVRERLGVAKVALLGVSGGTIFGLEMVRRRPDMFAVYVGTGQFVHWARQEELSYRMVLEEARRAGQDEAVSELELLGPPPYENAASDAIKSRYATAMTPAEQRVFATLDPAERSAMAMPPEEARWAPHGLPTFDRRALAGETYGKLRPEIVVFDAWKLGLEFAVPMFFFQGGHDAYSMTSEVERYVEEISAPLKKLIIVPDGGHSCVFLRDEFLRLLDLWVRPTALDTGGGTGGEPAKQPD